MGGELRERGKREGHATHLLRDTRNAPLSTCHNSPQIEYREGASLLTVRRKREKTGETQKGRGEVAKRGAINGFSNKSKNRLMRTLAGIKKTELPCFVTLTYPAVYSDDPKDWKNDLDRYLKRLARKFPNVAGVWKLEPQKRGAPHYHLLIWGASYTDLLAFTVKAWHEIAGNGDENHLKWHAGALGNKPCVSQVESQRGVFWYASKYMSKPIEGWENVGRFWGVFFRERLPQGKLITYEVTEAKALEAIRYMKRFAHLKSRDYKTLTIICNADHWINSLSPPKP